MGPARHTNIRTRSATAPGSRFAAARWLRRLALGGALLLAAAGGAQAETITVTSSADSGPGTLRAAISAANASPEDSTIRFDAATDSQPIVLQSALPDLPAAGGALTIEGNDPADTIIDGDDQYRPLRVNFQNVDLTLRELTIRNGHADQGQGGAVYYVGSATSSLAIDTVAFDSNRASYDGGAIYTTANTTVANSLFTNNRSGTFGSAIHQDSHELRLSNSTVFETNSHPISLRVQDGAAWLTHVTLMTRSNASLVASGSSSKISLINSIVLNDRTGAPSIRLDADGEIDLAASSGNLIGAPGNSGFQDGVNGNQVGVSLAEAGLGELADNGGPTRSVLPQAGSPAIDHGNSDHCATADQRGIARPVGAGCDAGAVEVRQARLTVHVTTPHGVVDNDSVSGQPFNSGAITACAQNGQECSAWYSIEPSDATVVLQASPDTGWHLDSWGGACSGSAGSASLALDQDRACTAAFAINSYTVSFVDWDGTQLDSQSVDHGGAATAPADPTRTGYTFTGWDVDFSNITADLTVTARYSVQQFTLSYSAGTGGTITGTAVQTVDYGDSGSAVEAVADNGYQFVKWSDGVTTASRTDTQVQDNITVQAQFAADKQRVLILPEGPYSGQELLVDAPTGSDWVLTHAATATTDSLGTPPPARVTLPHGVVSLELQHGAAGSSTSVVLHYPQGALQADMQYYKFGPTPDNDTAHWYVFDGASIDAAGNTITLELKDNAAGDAALDIDSLIRDPGGPAVANKATVAPIPTLGQWALLMLAGILAGSGLRREFSRRHEAAQH